MSKEQNTPGIERRRFHPYPKYKDSGVGWLGKIPAHWDIARIKEQFCIANGSTPSSSDPSFWDGDIVWVTPDDLGELHVSRLGDSRRKITEEGYKSCGTRIVPKGSIVVSTRAPIGYVAIATTNLCTNQGCKSLVPKRPLSTGFFYYQLSSAKNELESRGEGSTFKEISKDKLGLIILTKPPEPDQHSIAFFLDCETAKIDALIEKKERLIELLQEKRTALITRAVTKGLDLTVDMKNSGVEWLGEIPMHWSVHRLKLLASINDEALSEKTDPQFEMIYVDIGGVDKIEGIAKREECLFETAPSRARRIVKDGDVIISTVRTYLRAITPIRAPEYNLIVSTGFAVVRPTSRLNCDYAAYALRATYFVENIVANSTGVSYPAIEASKVSSFSIAFPELMEQQRIAAYVDKETAQIDKLISRIREAITSLSAYRTALISSAVTGKIDVREA